MNINKKLIKGTAITAAAATIIVGTGFHMVNAADINNLNVNTANVIQVAENETTASVVSASDADATAYKDETVYIMADTTGATKKVIVSDWLKNANASAGLSDVSVLKDIMNVKGDETFDTSGEDVTWNAQGKDIYYQGTTENELPVNVKVTYLLDGTEITPEELEGKSGKLTVRYDYTNLLKNSVEINGKKEDIYTPLLMVTGTILPTDSYRNVEVTNGKIISDGNNQVVVGISLPGLSDSLKVDNDTITIPEYFEYTADVTNYTAGTSVSVGLTDIFSGLDINGQDMDLDSIQNKIDELVDGVDQLVDGSDQLYKGLATLQDKTKDFKEGVSTLASSLTKLQSALPQLNSGAAKLNKGANALSTGLNTLTTNLSTAKKGMDQIVSNYSKVTAGVTQLSGAASTAKTGLDTLQTSVEQVNKTYATLASTVDNDEQLIAALKQVNTAYKDENIAAIIQKLEANTAGQKKIATGLTSAGSQISGGIKKLSAGTKQLQTGVTSLSTAITALSDGSKTVQSGLAQLETGSKKLQTGAKDLVAGTSTLASNTKELEVAGSKLGTASSTLVNGTNQLADAVTQLKDGSYTLKDGINTLKTEGIDNIVDTLEGDLQNIVDRFKAVVDQSKAYKNFSGIGSEMDGNVKFIIKYENTNEK